MTAGHGLQRSKKRVPLTAKAESQTNGRVEGPVPIIVQGVGVNIPQRNEQVAHLHIVGISPLITHAWSKKAIDMMLGKQMGTASAGREKKDPFADFEGSLYKVEGGGYGMPAPAFKAAAVGAANDVKMKMTESRRAFHVMTYTIPITGPKITKPLNEWDEKYWDKLQPYLAHGIHMRQDLVRLETGVADIRFRPEWTEWECDLTVEYNANVITLEQLVNLFHQGGYGSGIGEWRPSSPVCRSGEYGRFKIV